jgi:hypothetical protein
VELYFDAVAMLRTGPSRSLYDPLDFRDNAAQNRVKATRLHLAAASPNGQKLAG